MRNLALALTVLCFFAGTDLGSAQPAPAFAPALAAVGPMRVLKIGGNQGNQAFALAFTNGFLSGTCTIEGNTAAFNAMTPADIRASYDILVCTWAGDPALNLDWTTRVLPFLQLGGSVIFEDNQNASDLSPGITAFDSSPGGPYILSPVPGLTDGVSGSFANDHISISAWNGSIFTPFITNGSGATLGLYGQIPGGGRMVLTSPDQDYHSSMTPPTPNNQGLFLLNELTWAFAGVVAPVLSQFDALKAMIPPLVGPGKLSAAYASTMMQMLDRAKARYQEGKPAQAITLLRSFKSYVSRALASGWLTPAEAAALNSAADALIAAMSPV